MMIASVIGGVLLALTIDRASKLAGADNQRILKHPAHLEILNQSGPGLIDVLALASLWFKNRPAFHGHRATGRGSQRNRGKGAERNHGKCEYKRKLSWNASLPHKSHGLFRKAV